MSTNQKFVNLVRQRIQTWFHFLAVDDPSRKTPSFVRMKNMHYLRDVVQCIDALRRRVYVYRLEFSKECSFKDLINDEIEKATQLANRLLNVLFVNGMKISCKTETDFFKLVLSLIKSELGLLPYSHKEKTLILDGDLQLPDFHFLSSLHQIFHGTMANYFRNAIRSYKRRSERNRYARARLNGLINSLLKSYSALPTYFNTYDACVQHESICKSRNNLVCNPVKITKLAKDCIDDVCATLAMDCPKWRYPVRVPSTSACLGGSRTNIGQYGALSKTFEGRGNDHTRTLVGYTGHPFNKPIYSKHPNQASLLNWKEDFVNEVEPMHVNIGGKVRVLTKGEPAIYHSFRSYGKFLIKSLKRNPVFAYATGPIHKDQTHLARLASKHKGDKLISTDYVNATDYIYSESTLSVINSLEKYLGWDRRLVEKLRASFSPQVNYDDWLSSLPFEYKGATNLKQSRGQLMGHPLSFPILCILNAASCLMYYRKYEGYRGSIKQAPFLVNGDDLCFRAIDRFKFSEFESCCSVFGFILNRNKCLISTTVGSLNSRRFIFGVDDSVRLCPQLIPSIIDSDCKRLDWEEILSYSTPSTLERAKSIIFRRLKSTKTCRPWFLPSIYGGLDIPSINTDFPLTPFQRNAKDFFVQDELAFTISGVKTKYEFSWKGDLSSIWNFPLEDNSLLDPDHDATLVADGRWEHAYNNVLKEYGLNKWGISCDYNETIAYADFEKKEVTISTMCFKHGVFLSHL